MHGLTCLTRCHLNRELLHDEAMSPRHDSDIGVCAGSLEMLGKNLQGLAIQDPVAAGDIAKVIPCELTHSLGQNGIPHTPGQTPWARRPRAACDAPVCMLQKTEESRSVLWWVLTVSIQLYDLLDRVLQAVEVASSEGNSIAR